MVLLILLLWYNIKFTKNVETRCTPEVLLILLHVHSIVSRILLHSIYYLWWLDILSRCTPEVLLILFMYIA